MKEKKSLVKDVMDLAVGTVIGGATIGIVQGSNIPSHLRTGISNLIGVKILDETAKKITFKPKF